MPQGQGQWNKPSSDEKRLEDAQMELRNFIAALSAGKGDQPVNLPPMTASNGMPIYSRDNLPPGMTVLGPVIGDMRLQAGGPPPVADYKGGMKPDHSQGHMPGKDGGKPRAGSYASQASVVSSQQQWGVQQGGSYDPQYRGSAGGNAAAQGGWDPSWQQHGNFNQGGGWDGKQSGGSWNPHIQPGKYGQQQHSSPNKGGYGGWNQGYDQGKYGQSVNRGSNNSGKAESTSKLGSSLLYMANSERLENQKPALEVAKEFQLSHIQNNSQASIVKYFALDEKLYRFILMWEGFSEGLITFDRGDSTAGSNAGSTNPFNDLAEPDRTNQYFALMPQNTLDAYTNTKLAQMEIDKQQAAINRKEYIPERYVRYETMERQRDEFMAALNKFANDGDENIKALLTAEKEIELHHFALYEIIRVSGHFTAYF